MGFAGGEELHDGPPSGAGSRQKGPRLTFQQSQDCCRAGRINIRILTFDKFTGSGCRELNLVRLESAISGREAQRTVEEWRPVGYICNVGDGEFRRERPAGGQRPIRTIIF